MSVAEDGVDHLLGVAALAKNLCSVERVLLGRVMSVVRPALVVEIMKQAGYAPQFFVGAGLARVGAHAGFDGQSMLAQAFTLCVLAQKVPSVGAVQHGLTLTKQHDLTIRSGTGRA